MVRPAKTAQMKSKTFDKIAAGLADAIAYARGDTTKGRVVRGAFYAHELPEEVVAALPVADFSHIDPDLDRLMD